MVDAIENRTFDEIKVGDSASVTRTFTRQDIEQWAAITGNFNLEETFEQGSGQAMWAATLFSTLAGVELPGLGSITEDADVRMHRPISHDRTITATIRVVEKIASSRSVILDCRCVDASGEAFVTATIRVRTPDRKIRRPRDEAPIITLLRNHRFDDLIARCEGLPATVTAVCHPCGDYALKGAIEAAEAGLILPLLVGPTAKIRAVADQEGLDISRYQLIDAPHSHASAEQSVALARAGSAQAIMKGSLHSDELLAAIMSKDSGLRTERRISHCFLVAAPTYARRVIVTDAAININPTLDDKVDICQNAIALARVIGIERPKVAILAAVEIVNARMQATLDAAALCKMADRRQITGGLLDGPLGFDNAVSKEAAATKGIVSPVAGEADILLVPDLESGNMVAKQLTYMAHAEAAGLVIGARCPVVLTSRADSDYARFASCALAVLFAEAQRRDPGLLKGAD